jgi:hypothetical protein
VSAGLAAALMILGALMVIRAVGGGGGPTAYGVIVGVLFFAAGAARLWVERRSRDR